MCTRIFRISSYFNSRPCGRGFIPGGQAEENRELFQFTPLREGLLPLNTRQFIRYSISIHAPAGGASLFSQWLRHAHIISIHAPAGGASIISVNAIVTDTFQFTPLREGLHCQWLRKSPLKGHFNSRPCGRGFSDGLSRKC